MDPPAQLARVGSVADLDHAHHVAVLLAEERHRPEALGLVEGGDDRVDRRVVEDPGVHLVLDRPQLVGREAVAVGEVEAQLVGPDVGARLADVGAELLAQGGVEQVRRGVVGAGCAASPRLDPGDDPLPRRELALLDHERDGLVVAEPEDLVDAGPAVARVTFDDPDVGDLAAARGIER